MAADLLEEFLKAEIGTSWSDVCPENSVAPCTRRLKTIAEQMVTQYALGSAWHIAITQLRASTNVHFGGPLLKSLPEADRFEDAWASVIKIAGSAKDQKSASPAMIKPEMQPALAKTIAPLNELLRAVNNQIDDERFDRASKEFENIRTFLDVATPGQSELENVRQQFKALKKPSRADGDWRDVASNLKALSGQVDGLQPKLLQQAEKSLLSAETQACASGVSRFDPGGGVVEFCYKPNPNAALQIIGLRYKFPPCPASVVPCSADGDLQLLWRVGRDGPVVIQPLGLVDVRSLVSPIPGQNTPRIALRDRAPSQTAYRMVDDILADAVRRVFGPSIAARAIQVDVSDGPEVRMVLSLGVNLPGIADATQMTIKFTPTGVMLNDQNSIDDLVLAVENKISANLVGRSIQFKNWNLQILSAKHRSDCRSTASFEISARSTLPANLSSVDTVLTLCDGKSVISVQPNQPQLAQALAKQIQQTIGGDAVRFFVANDDHLHASVNLSVGKCAVPVELDLQGAFKEEFSGASKALQCAVSEATKEVVFTLASGLGFKKTAQPDVYCSDPIPAVGVLCATGVKPPFTSVSASLQNEAQLLQTVRDGLRSIVGDAAVLKTVQLKDGHVVAIVDLTLPSLGQVNDIKFEITNKGLSGSFEPAFHAAVNSALTGKVVDIAGVQVSKISVLNDAPLALHGDISYGGVSVPARIDILPSFKVTPEKPDLNSLLSAIQQLLGSVSAVKDLKFIDSPEGVPAIQAEVDVSVPLIGQNFAVGAVLEAKAGGTLKFAGPVSIRLPLPWFEIWWLALGRIRSRLDLNKPLNDISIGASLTIIPGEGSYEIIGLDGDLHIQPGKVGLDSTLAIISIPLGRSTGEWRYSEGMLVVDVGTTNLPDIVPLPSGHLVVDGRACAVAGSASAKFQGAQIASLGAGVLIGDICKAGPPRDSLIGKLTDECGSDRGPIGRVCIFGDVRFGAINGTGKFSSRLDQIFPNISGDIELAGLAHFSVGVNPTRAKLSTSVLGFRLAVVLPNVEGLDEAFLRQLIESLLKPSIDLQALLRGDITIAPASKGDRGDDAMVADNDDNNKPGDGKESSKQNPSAPAAQQPGAPKQTPPSAKAPPGGDYRGPPGPIKLSVRQYESSAYWQVYAAVGNQQIPWFPFYFNKADAEDLRSGQLVIFSRSPLETSTSITLFACDGWECKTSSIVGITGYKTPDTKLAPQPRTKINIDSQLQSVTSKDDSFKSSNPKPDGMFTYPAIITYVAGLALTSKTSPVSLVCARKTNGTCAIEYWRDPDVVALIHRGDLSIQSIPLAAWGRSALEKACQGQCDEAKIAPFLDFEGSLLALNSRVSPTLVVRHSFRWDPSSHSLFKVIDTLDALSADLAPVKSWSLNAHLAEGYRPFDLWHATVSHPLLEDLLAAIAGQATSDASVSIWSSSEQFASAVLSDKNNTTTMMWSAVQQNGKSCIRNQTFQFITNQLGNWSQQGFVDAGYAEKLVKPEGRDELMRSLAAPSLKPGQFNLNPMLLFGDPAAASCK
ncbi:hypothetical protein [Bradyrhizobium sp. USDA 4469]